MPGVGSSGNVLTSDGSNWASAPPSVPSGYSQLVKIHHYVDNAYKTGTYAMPVDNTIPQIGEGDEFMRIECIPVSATSTLLIDVHIDLAASTSDEVCAALFVDSTVNALVATTQFMANGSPLEHNAMRIVHKVASTNTTARIYKVRAGQGSGAGVLHMNGSDDAIINGKYAGRAHSTITITEYED